MSNMSYNDGANVIWKVLDIFRGYFTPDKYGLLLYLIHAHKTGLLKFYYDNETSPIAESIDHALSHDECNYPEYELDLFRLYAPDLSDSFHRKAFSDIYSQLRNLNDDWYTKYEAELFDELIEKFINSTGRYGEGLQQLELTKFISSISPYKGNGVLYNPFAGSATYGTELAGNGIYLGQEINYSTWAIGVMRLLAHGKSAFDFTRQNSIREWGVFSSDKSYDNYKFDCIIATPPYGLKIDPIDSFPNYYNRVEDFLISKCLDSLAPNGTAIIVAPQGISFMGGQSLDLRKQYILNDRLDTVILLPSGAFCYSTVPAVILIFANNKEHSGYIRMVNGSKFVNQTERRKGVSYDALLNAITTSNPNYVKLVTTADIINNDFSLLPTIYFKTVEPLPEGFIQYKLSSISKIENGTRCNQSETMGKVVRINQLSSDPFHNTLDIDSLPEEALNNQYRKITKEVLLLSKVRSLKPTSVQASETSPIYINSNILALQITSEQIDIDCLILALSQKVDLQVGDYIPNINQAFIMNIVLNLPGNLSAQKAYYLNAEQAFKLAQVKELGLEELISRREKDFDNILRRRKHDMINLMKSAFGSLENIISFLEEKGLTSEYIDKDLDWKVSDCTRNLRERYYSVFDIIKHIADKEEFNKPVVIDLIDRLNKLASKHHRLYKINFTKDVNTLFDNEQGQEDDMPHAFIQFGDINLDIVFNNIIINAEQHGFTDPTRTDYVIEINLSYDQESDCYVIRFDNNGNSLPLGINTERYGIRGEKAGVTSGKGDGGAIVKNNIEFYHGSYSIISKPDSWFKVCVELKIPRYNER